LNWKTAAVAAVKLAAQLKRLSAARIPQRPPPVWSWKDPAGEPAGGVTEV
jgi:hypothetical protein